MIAMVVGTACVVERRDLVECERMDWVVEPDIDTDRFGGCFDDKSGLSEEGDMHEGRKKDKMLTIFSTFFW